MRLRCPPDPVQPTTPVQHNGTPPHIEQAPTTRPGIPWARTAPTPTGAHALTRYAPIPWRAPPRAPGSPGQAYARHTRHPQMRQGDSIPAQGSTASLARVSSSAVETRRCTDPHVPITHGKRADIPLTVAASLPRVVAEVEHAPVNTAHQRRCAQLAREQLEPARVRAQRQHEHAQSLNDETTRDNEHEHTQTR